MSDILTAHAAPDIQKAAEALKQWTILNPGGGETDVRPGQRYLLKNSTNRHFLHYKKQGFAGGINLGFSDNARRPPLPRSCTGNSSTSGERR